MQPLTLIITRTTSKTELPLIWSAIYLRVIHSHRPFVVSCLPNHCCLSCATRVTKVTTGWLLFLRDWSATRGSTELNASCTYAMSLLLSRMHANECMFTADNSQHTVIRGVNEYSEIHTTDTVALQSCLRH